MFGVLLGMAHEERTKLFKVLLAMLAIGGQLEEDEGDGKVDSESLSSASATQRMKRGELLRMAVLIIWFRFMVGTMCSSKCSIAMDEMSLSSCNSSYDLGGFLCTTTSLSTL